MFEDIFNTLDNWGLLPYDARLCHKCGCVFNGLEEGIYVDESDVRTNEGEGNYCDKCYEQLQSKKGEAACQMEM